MSSTRLNRRKQRRVLKGGRAVPLNIVSMIDIFAILVFFLLINYWQVDVAVTQVKDVQLPESISIQDPKDAIIVTVTAQDILVQGQKIMLVSDALLGKDIALPAVQTALEQEASRKPPAPVATKSGAPVIAAVQDRKVIIMGDKSIPYHLLKRVMLSCSQAHYANISLAVIDKKPGKPG